MKKTEKFAVAALTVALGVLLIAFQEDIVKIATSVLGIVCIAFGVLDLFNRFLPPAVIKLVAGLVIILFGVFAVQAVLYLLAALLLIAGILLLYEKLKRRVRCLNFFQSVCAYALPAICIVIGVLLLFNGGNTVTWVFVVSGFFVVLEGSLLLVDAFTSD